MISIREFRENKQGDSSVLLRLLAIAKRYSNQHKRENIAAADLAPEHYGGYVRG
jgi:hypothetical protein